MKDEDGTHHGCICYDLVKTLSPTGTVSRGICKVDSENNLVRIDERKNMLIKRKLILNLGFRQRFYR